MRSQLFVQQSVQREGHWDTRRALNTPSRTWPASIWEMIPMVALFRWVTNDRMVTQYSWIMNQWLLSNGWLLTNDQNSALGSTTLFFVLLRIEKRGFQQGHLATEDRFQEVSGSLARKSCNTFLHGAQLATAVSVPRKIAQSRGKLLQVCEVLERSRYDNNRKYIKLSSFLLLEQLIPGSKKKDRRERPSDMHFVSIYSVFAMGEHWWFIILHHILSPSFPYIFPWKQETFGGIAHF